MASRIKINFLSLTTIFAFINYAAWTLSWLIYVDNVGRPKDWLLFWDTSNLLASGSLGVIYPGVTPNLPFMYPPIFLFLIYPLRYLSKSAAYIVLVVFAVIMLLLSFRVLSAIFKLNLTTIFKLFIIILSTASWLVMLPLGHFSSLYLFIICAGLKLLTLNMSWQAGAVLSLLMLKPNIGIIFPLLFLLRREFKLLIGWIVGIGILLFLSIFVFKTIWWDYISFITTFSGVIEEIPPWKHHTLLAFLRSFLHSNNQQFVYWVWLASAFSLIGLCSYTWYTTEKSNNYYPRLFGIAILAIIVCNPYLHYYDAIIAALPLIVWFSNRGQYYFRFSYALIGVLLGLAYLIQQISVLYIQKGFSLVGIPLALCLIIDCFDLISLNTRSYSDRFWKPREGDVMPYLQREQG